MALRLVSPPRSLYLYGRGLRFLSQSSQRFTSDEDRRNPKSVQGEPVDVTEESETIWPDQAAKLLGPSDHRLPLPGDVGHSHHLVPPIPSSQPEHPHIVNSPVSYDRQLQVLYQFFNPFDSIDDNTLSDEDLRRVASSTTEVLEFSAKPCPQLLRRELQDLFPERSLKDGTLTVVTVVQPTSEDMTVWSEAVETEREELTHHFIAVAQELCGTLTSEGYWADFIDPTSGRPYFGAFTNSSLFETDEGYRHLGFQIEDLGCCKVIRHSAWGTRVFVGCLLTSAPVYSPALARILSRHQQT